MHSMLDLSSLTGIEPVPLAVEVSASGAHAESHSSAAVRPWNSVQSSSLSCVSPLALFHTTTDLHNLWSVVFKGSFDL